MTKKIIAFGASSSRNSINKQLATFAANQFKNTEVEILDLNDYEMPLFSVDKEKENGNNRTILLNLFLKDCHQGVRFP